MATEMSGNRMLELEFDLRKKNNMINGSQCLQKSTFVHGKRSWDLELVSTSTFPSEKEDSERTSTEPINEAISAIKSVDPTAEDDNAYKLPGLGVEPESFLNEVFEEINKICETEYAEEINNEICETDGAEEIKKEIDETAGTEKRRLEINSNIHNTCNDNNSNNETDKVIADTTAVLSGVDLTADDSDDSDDSEEVEVNIKFSKKDLKRHMLALRNLAGVDPSTDEPLYAIIRKDKKKPNDGGGEKYVIGGGDDCLEPTSAANLSINDDVQDETMQPLSSQVPSNVVQVDPGYESLESLQEEIKQSCEFTRIKERSCEEVEMVFDDLDDDGESRPDFVVFLPKDGAPVNISQTIHSNMEISAEYTDDDGTRAHNVLDNNAYETKDVPITDNMTYKVAETQIVANTTIQNGANNTVSLNGSRNIPNGHTHASNDIYKVKDTQLVHNSTYKVTDTQLTVSKTVTQNGTSQQNDVSERDKITIKDTPIVISKASPQTTRPNNYNGVSNGEVHHDNVSMRSTGSKRSLKKHFRGSMPASLMRYFNPEKPYRNSGDFSSLRKEKKKVFGSSESLSSTDSKNSTRNKKKTLSLRKKPDEHKIDNEINDYSSFLTEVDVDHIDLDHEIAELMKMNRVNKTKDKEPTYEEGTLLRPLFDIPEQGHFNQCYAGKVTNPKQLHSGPVFTELTNRYKADSSRETSGLGEGFLY